MQVVIVDDQKQPRPYDLDGRFCDILLWLLRRAEFISGSDRGNVQIDFAGQSLTMSFKDISESQQKTE